MAKKTFRIKDKQGNDVDYVIPASRVALDPNTDLDEKIGDIEDEIDEVESSAVKKITFNGGTPETPDEHGNVSLNQAKSDWTEKDSNSPKFIEHKPDIVEDVFYEEQTRTFKKNMNGTVSEIMTLPEQGGGGYEPPQGGIPKTDLATAVQESLNLADSSLQPSDKTQLQGAITQLQNALNTLIGSGNVQGVIDTFNEVKAFLDGIDTSDPTLANQLLALNNAISAVQTSLAAKANDNIVVKSISVNGQTPQTPQNGNVNIIVQGAAGEDGITPHIGQNGNWWIGPETDANNDTNIKAQGPMGSVTITDGDIDTLEVHNALNAYTGLLGMSGAMLIRSNIESLYASLNRLYGKLANMAFWDATDQAAAQPTALDWSLPKHSVAITNNLANSSITRNGESVGNSFQAEEGSTVTLIVAAASSSYALTNVTYVKDGGSSTNATSLGDGTYKIEFVMGSSDVAIAVSGTAVAAYGVTLNLSNCSKVSGPTSVVSGSEATFVFEAEQGYALPSANPNVTGASVKTWTKSTGALVIENVAGAVTIAITAVEALPYEVPEGGELLYWWDGKTVQSGDTAWVDRIGQISVPKASNTDTGTTPDPTNHCWNFNSGYNTYPHGLAIMNSSLDDIDADDCTIEVVYKAKFDGSFTRANVCVFHRRESSGTYGVPGGIYFCSKNGASATDAFICGCNAGDVADGTWDNSNVNDEICCIGMNNDDAVKNGSALALKTGSNATGLVTNTGNEAGKGAICIGCYSNGNVYSVFKGNIYAIRIYSGHLTAAQMLANQKVDNERYNLGLTLPDSVQ